MSELLYSLDAALFIFCNQSLANPMFDFLMPLLTDLNKHWWGLSAFGASWLLLFWKGGRKGRIVAALLLVCILATDQLNSSFLKAFFHRARPCHQIGGVPVVEHIRLLVDCGGGYSFPSSHAANNFGAAFLLSYFYRSWGGAFFLFAGAVGFSRISVGVHYPSDVLAGGAVGVACAAFIVVVWSLAAAHFPRLDSDPPPAAEVGPEQGS